MLVGSLRDSARILEMPEVLPADVLSRRPDVLKAEYDVPGAAHHSGGQGRARLPTFSSRVRPRRARALLPR